jgi:hypothetical protein
MKIRSFALRFAGFSFSSFVLASAGTGCNMLGAASDTPAASSAAGADAGAAIASGAGAADAGTPSAPGADGGAPGPNMGPDGAAPPGPLAELVPCPEYPQSKDPKCKQAPEKRTVGAGVAFPDSATDGVTASLQGGFIDAANNRLVLAAAGVLLEGKKFGAVFTVDLATGNRTVLSGLILDPSEGPKRFGKGPELVGQNMSIAPGPDGFYVTASDIKGIIKIDPATGDRSLAVDFAAPAFASGPCSSQTSNLTLAPNGKIYRSWVNIKIGAGIVEMTPGPSPTCRALLNRDDAAVGSGAKPNDPWDVMYSAGKVWVLDKRGAALFAVDPATSVSRKVSSGSGDPGSGDKCFGIDGSSMNDQVVWTFTDGSSTGIACNPSQPGAVIVDTADGKRTGVKKLADGPTDSYRAVVALPGQKTKALFLAGAAVYIYDSERSLMNIVSR